MGSIQRRGMVLLHLGDAKKRMQPRGHHGHNRRSQPRRRSAHRGSSPADPTLPWSSRVLGRERPCHRAARVVSRSVPEGEGEREKR